MKLFFVAARIIFLVLKPSTVVEKRFAVAQSCQNVKKFWQVRETSCRIPIYLFIVLINFSSVWGDVIPLSFVIPNEWKMFKQYLSENDTKHDGNNAKASILSKNIKRLTQV